jgi:hypothetical protein
MAGSKNEARTSPKASKSPPWTRFRGYANAIRDTPGRRGRKDVPLFNIRRTLQQGIESLTEKQVARLEKTRGGRSEQRGFHGLAFLPKALGRLPRPARTRTQARRRDPRQLPHLPDPGDRQTLGAACGHGRGPSWRTSIPAEHPIALLKPSTDSSKPPAASHEDSATSKTTESEIHSPQEATAPTARKHLTTLRDEGPNWGCWPV